LSILGIDPFLLPPFLFPHRRGRTDRGLRIAYSKTALTSPPLRNHPFHLTRRQPLLGVPIATGYGSRRRLNLPEL
jgi:hypothetical protein